MSAVGVRAVAGVVPSLVRRNADWPEEFRKRLESGTVKGDPYRGGNEVPDPKRLPLVHMARFAADPYRGTVERRILEPDRLPSDLEIEAARKVLTRASVDPRDLDLLICHSIVADELLPRNDAKLHHLLGLRSDAGAITVDTICSSMATQLVTARGLVANGDVRRILCITSSCHSRIADWHDTSSLYFGDAAAAFVVESVPETYGILGWAMRTDGSLHNAIRWDRERMVTIFEHEPQKLVIGQLVDQCRGVVSAALDRAGIGLDAIDLFISHQPVAWFHPMCLDALGLPPERGFDTFTRYANISACCLSLNLAEAVEQGRIHKGDRILFFGANAGYGYIALVLRWSA